MLLLGSGGMLWLSTTAPLVFAVPLVLLGTLGVVSPFVKMLMWSPSITVTEEGIEAVNYARRRTRIRWSELRRVEHLNSYSFGCSEFVRLVGSGRSVNFTDAIDRYPELLALLETRGGHVPWVRLPRIWLLLLVGGLGGTMPSRSGGADTA